jgi:molybdopterin adenylyltransferase
MAEVVPGIDAAGGADAVEPTREEAQEAPVERAFVLTISDGVAAGTRDDESGGVLEAQLVELGWEVDRAVVPDDPDQVVTAVEDASIAHLLVVTTGGTGLGPRDRTPQALARLLDYEIPGFGEVMRAAGRRSTPLADLSRSLAGAYGSTLVVAVPGSPRGALESLAAIEPVLDHAIETLGGRTQVHPEPNDAASVRVGEEGDSDAKSPGADAAPDAGTDPDAMKATPDPG